MTSNRNLVLNRLIVTSRHCKVYDETFHAGVNIIRGKNSSGKSTITDMIFYVLGGENTEWTDEALSCEWVYAEVVLSGLIFSLRREISQTQTHPSIAVCEGHLSKTMHSEAGWGLYGRQRSSSKESFSQFMFEKLGLPETKADDSQANVTMYQVLRLLYADQNTDCTSLFRRERQPFADRQDIRRSVGEMLLGIDDLRGHELRLEYIQFTKLLSQRRSRLDSLVEAAVKTDPNFTLTQYSNMIDNAQEKLVSLEHEIEQLSRETDDVATSIREDDVRDKVMQLEQMLKNFDATISGKRKSIQDLSAQISDSEVFIASLETDLAGLLAANKSREIIGDVSFHYCPLCLAALSESSSGQCPLCKSGLESDAIAGGRLRFEQELKHQIAESAQLLSSRIEALANMQRTLRNDLEVRDSAITELRTFVTPMTNIDPRISRLLKEHGYTTRLIEDLKRLSSLQEDVGALEMEVKEVQSRVDAIDREIRLRRSQQDERRTYCQDRIGELTIDVLHNDIIDANNDTLQDATGLVFSFEKDFLSVRHGRLSASTQAFLKSSFYLGLLKFSIEDKYSRLPLFFVLDNIEDKGMVPERFRRFHHLLIEYSESVTVSHQVILTTSYIDNTLNDSEYCVGPSYDQPPFTLDLHAGWRDERSAN